MTYTLTDMMQAGRTTDRAVRWWEAQGLLGKVERSVRGHRRYTADQMERAKFIGAAQAAGWDLKEIQRRMLDWAGLRNSLELQQRLITQWLAEVPEYDL